MTQTPSAESANAPAKSLPARFVGILFAPRATYAAVAAHPRWLGIFLAVVLISASAAVALMSTQVGRDAVIDQQVASREAFGRPMTQAEIDRVEQFAPYFVYVTPAFQVLGFGVGALIIAGIAFAVFNAMLGGDASFTQVFAIVTHSGVVLATLSIFTTPLAYARGSLSGTTNLAVFVPFLHDTSFVARLLGALDLIFIWWIISLAIGLGVLYRKRTGPIAATMLAVYAAIGVIIAAVKMASTGA
jgi:Yip1 domain